ncbi:hypothetical protein [Halomarina oriensis]|uniref:Uncharacterized protein n=1 Tax=Halomarina oriensis TaxID=671145 RepID=A0A6B0GSL7_9EURY|nr:hypothetical protein [Halomarina oriensis]MWG35095.1 hypothetical protein [Halomarina oriensis]
MRALPVLLVCCVLLAGCVSGLTLPGESPNTETDNGTVYVVESGETVRVGVGFDGVRELHPESTDSEAIAFESASFSPGSSSVAQSLPPYYVWDARTDVEGIVEYSVAEDAESGDYPVTVTAWSDGDHSHENGTTERIVIRVVENESG